MEYPKTRKEAKEVGAKFYFTGLPCTQGHVALRKTKGVCTACLKAEWTKSNAIRAEKPKSTAAKLSGKRYYERNREQVIARANARPTAEKNAYKKNWKLRNPLWAKADARSRRRKHRQATPRWLTDIQKAEMRNLYMYAVTLTKTTGERYVVDHIVPLRGKEVCGLHVPWNLRVITHAENLKKSNKHE